MFTTLIVQPIFNLLSLIYGILPGHNFGVAIIIFTIIVRLLMWPLIKKQLHQTKKLRKLQPELKKIKKAAKGDRQREAQLQMELYRERGVSPFASLLPLLIQLPIFIGLYLGLQRVVKDPREMIDFSYGFIQNLPFLRSLSDNIGQFDETLFGIVDLTKAALGAGGIYWPAMIIVLASVVIQFYQSKQLMPQTKDARKLREILRDAGQGKQADQDEVNAAIGRSTKYMLPALIFIVTVNIASALSLYWLVSGIVAFIQQHIVLSKDEEEMEEIADAKPSGKGKKKPAAKSAAKTSSSSSEILINGKPYTSVADIPEAEVVASKTKPKAKSTKRRK